MFQALSAEKLCHSSIFIISIIIVIVVVIIIIIIIIIFPFPFPSGGACLPHAPMLRPAIIIIIIVIIMKTNCIWPILHWVCKGISK